MKSKLLGALLFFCALSAHALDLKADVEARDDQYLLNIRLLDFPAKEVLKSIQDGYRTEVKFFIQVFLRDHGAFIQDKMIWESKPIFSASWDIFQKEYQIEMPDGGLVSFTNSQVFVQVLSQLLFYPLNIGNADMEGKMLFANVRAEVIPVKLVPPINLLTFFTDRYRQLSAWKTVSIRGDFNGR